MGLDPLTAGILAGGTLLSGASQSRGAREAASAQRQAADEAAQVQREALQQFRLASEPFRFGGQQAINPLLSALGIAPIGLPTQPTFQMIPQQTIDRRSEIQTRLDELIARRNQLSGG